MQNEYLYHYTSIVRLIQIINDNKLKVSNKEYSKSDSALWFSKNQEWEPTATKITMNEQGQIVKMTKDEQHELIGLARIGIVKSPLLNTWAKYRHISKLPFEFLDMMEEVGIKQGAKVSDWFCFLNDLSLSNCEVIQIWDGRNWIAFDLEDEKQIEFVQQLFSRIMS